MDSEIRPGLHVFASYALLLCALFALFQFLLIPAHVKTSEARNTFIAQREQNSRFAAAIGQYEEALAGIALADANPRPAASTRLLHAPTTALAGAALQASLRSLAMDSGVLLTASTIVEGERSGNFQKLSINMHFQGSVESLARFINEVELQDQALFFDNVVIQSHHRRGGVLQSASDELEVRLEVYGFIDMPAENAAP